MPAILAISLNCFQECFSHGAPFDRVKISAFGNLPLVASSRKLQSWFPSGIFLFAFALSKDKNDEIRQLGRWLLLQTNKYKNNDQIMKDKNIRKAYEMFVEKYKL